MVRCLLVVGVVAGCSFQHGNSSPTGAAPDGAKPIDAAPMIDAKAIDAKAIDAPPDACPDADGDGICDALDTWPCGPLPAALPTSISDKPTGANLTMDTIDVSSQGQLVVAAKGASLTLSLHFTLTDTRCMMCIDQLEVGWMQNTTGPRSGCAWNGGVPNPGGVDRNVMTFAITAPTTAGAYDLRTNIGQNTSCGTGSWWANEVPAAATTIAKLCVH